MDKPEIIFEESPINKFKFGKFRVCSSCGQPQYPAEKEDGTFSDWTCKNKHNGVTGMSLKYYTEKVLGKIFVEQEWLFS